MPARPKPLLPLLVTFGQVVEGVLGQRPAELAAAHEGPDALLRLEAAQRSILAFAWLVADGAGLVLAGRLGVGCSPPFLLRCRQTLEQNSTQVTSKEVEQQDSDDQNS